MSIESDIAAVFGEEDGFRDSRGANVTMPVTTQVLADLLEMADNNLTTDFDIAFGDSGLTAMCQRQCDALATLGRVLESHRDILDAMPQPTLSVDFVEERTPDPSLVSGAIQICIETAEPGIPGFEVSDIPTAEEHDRQMLVIDYCQAFLLLNKEMDKVVAASPPEAFGLKL